MNLTVIRIAMRIGISCALIAVGAVDLFLVIRHMAWVGRRCYPQFLPWTLAEDHSRLRSQEFARIPTTLSRALAASGHRRPDVKQCFPLGWQGVAARRSPENETAMYRDAV